MLTRKEKWSRKLGCNGTHTLKGFTTMTKLKVQIFLPGKTGQILCLQASEYGQVIRDSNPYGSIALKQ